MRRIARFVALILAGCLVTVLSIGTIVFWPIISEAIAPPRSPALPPPPPPPKTQAPVAPRIALPPQPPRKGSRTWAEIEAAFDAVRKQRVERPEWTDALSDTYEIVANPEFTDSSELLDHCVKLSQWRREVPNSPTPLVALARAHIDWAWEARGPWLAASVSQEGWEKFHPRVAEAHRLLDEAIKLGVHDGEAYRLLIKVATAEGWPSEEARAALDEGRQIDPLYFPMYLQFARYLLPRWHGKRGDVERFAVEMAPTLPGDDGLELYARIAAHIHGIDAERELLFLGAYDRDLLVKAAEVLVQRRDGDRDAANFAALCAWAAQDRAAAKRLKPLIGEPSEQDPVWPWIQQRREFDQWCRSDKDAPTDEVRWFWGSLFDGHDLVFSSDSRGVWCGEGGGPTIINCLDITSGAILHSLPGAGGIVNCLAVDEPRGWAIAGIHASGVDGLVRWDFHEPERAVVIMKGERCQALAISPTAPLVAYGTYETVHLVNLQTKERGLSFKVPVGMSRLRFSADGNSLAVSAVYESVWDVATGKQKLELPHDRTRPMPDTRCVRILDIDADGYIWALVRKTKPPQEEPLLVKYAPGGETWEPVISNLAEHVVMQQNATLSADHTLLAINELHPSKPSPRIGIAVWNVKSGQRIKRFGSQDRGITMCFSPDGKWLASMGFPTGLVKLWSIEEPPAERKDAPGP